MILTLCELENNWWFVLTEQGLMLGWMYQEVDGYYVWQENPELSGFQVAWILRFLADMLDELNEPWDSIIQNDPAIS